MGLKWDTVCAEHVDRACKLVAEGKHRPRARAKGIFLVRDDQELPAKHVLRLAYLLAHNRPLDEAMRFASGEGTIRVLRGLGFIVVRRSVGATKE
jgi:hypothetical protein